MLVDDAASAITRGLPNEWTMKDEWYSFKSDPRATGAHVLLTLDESTYSPIEMGRNIGMGADHPIAWTRCLGKGRSVAIRRRETRNGVRGTKNGVQPSEQKRGLEGGFLGRWAGVVKSILPGSSRDPLTAF